MKTNRIGLNAVKAKALSEKMNILLSDFQLFYINTRGFHWNIKGENFTKKFLLNTDEIADNTLRFEIFCNKTKKSVTYEVNIYSRFVQEMTLNEVK